MRKSFCVSNTAQPQRQPSHSHHTPLKLQHRQQLSSALCPPGLNRQLHSLSPVCSTHHSSYAATAVDVLHFLESANVTEAINTPPLAPATPPAPRRTSLPVSQDCEDMQPTSSLDFEDFAFDEAQALDYRSELDAALRDTPGDRWQQHDAQTGPAPVAASRLVSRPKTSSSTDMPSSKPSKTGRRNVAPSPMHVDTLARVFKLSVEKAQSLAVSRPLLLSFSEEQILERVKQIASLLQTKESQALLAVRKQPFLLQVDLDTLRGRLLELQQQLDLDLQLTCRLCSNAPSVLKRPADKLGERFERIAQSLAMTKAEVVHMSGRCSHTQFLTERSRKLQARFQALAETLHLDADQAAKVVRKQPDVLFMSSRILANKVKVLQAVFGTKHKQITPLIAKCPEVLRRDMNSIRRIVCMLQVMLNVSPDVVFKMMSHNARLLSMSFQSTQWKASQLKDASNSCTDWAQEWQLMQPRHKEHCLSATQTTYSRLQYIMQTGQQEKVKLLDALRVPGSKFEQAFPEYSSWVQQQQLRQQLQL